MQLLVVVGVLIVSFAFRGMCTADSHAGGEAYTLRDEVDSLREELRGVRLELNEPKCWDNRKQEEIIQLQKEVTKLISARASTHRLLSNLREGLLMEKMKRKETQKDLAELKTKLSALQVPAVRLKCDPCMPGLPGPKRGPAHSAENGTCTDQILPGGISVGEFQFSRADGDTPDGVVIEAGGAAVGDGPRGAELTNVRTDGLFPPDRRVYWETQLNWSPKVSAPGSRWWRSVGGVGVRREGSDFGKYPGSDDQSWVVEIRCLPGKKTWRYRCHHAGKIVFSSAPVTATRSSVSHRLGLLLDPGNRTLTAVDVNTNSRLCTFSLPAGDAGSQRFVPLVRFGDPVYQRRFSLPGVDPCRLPGATIDLLHK